MSHTGNTRTQEQQKHERGRKAERPEQIPKPGWKDILKRTFKGLSADNASMIAAGVAFYAFTSVPAILTALVSIYGLVANPTDIQQQVNSLSRVVPGQALSIVSDQLKTIASHGGGTLTLSLVISVLFAFFALLGLAAAY